MTRLLLASASPARLATLRSAGLAPLVLVSRVDEDAVVARYGVTDPADVALVLAKAKAEDVAGRLHEDAPDDAGVVPDEDDVDDSGQDDLLVLGCDSVLELDGEPWGKPADAAEATSRWRRMRGRSGVLHTGHWLIDAREATAGGQGGTFGTVASATVHFADVSDAEIDAYVATGEPLAVAGAFTIDGLGGAFVRGVEGDPHTVVGVSLSSLREMLLEVGVPWTSLWAPRD